MYYDFNLVSYKICCSNLFRLLDIEFKDYIINLLFANDSDLDDTLRSLQKLGELMTHKSTAQMCYKTA